MEMADQEDGKRAFSPSFTQNMLKLIEFWFVSDYVTVKRFYKGSHEQLSEK